MLPSSVVGLATTVCIVFVAAVLEEARIVDVGVGPLMQTAATGFTVVVTSLSLMMSPGMASIAFLSRVLRRYQPVLVDGIMALFEPLSCFFALAAAVWLEDSPFREHPSILQLVAAAGAGGSGTVVAGRGVEGGAKSMRERWVIVAVCASMVLPFMLLLRIALANAWWLFGTSQQQQDQTQSSSPPSTVITLVDPRKTVRAFLSSHNFCAVLGFPFLHMAVLEWKAPVAAFTTKHAWEMALLAALGNLHVYISTSEKVARAQGVAAAGGGSKS